MAALVGCGYHILPVYIIQFLTLKRLRPDFLFPQVNDDDIYGFDPSELPGRSKFQSDDQVWYFFCKLKNVPSKSPTSLVARAAGAGYWKSTGQGSAVKNKDGNKIGWKRNLVYYKRERGPPPKEIKTKWVMHEFYVADSPLYKENYVICYIEKQPNKQPSVSTPGDNQPSSSSASESVNHNIEGTPTEIESLQLQSHFLISDTANHVTENTSTEVAPQPISSEILVPDSRDHVANKAFPVEEPQQIQSTLVSYPESHAIENTFSPVMKSMPHDSFQHQPMVDPQLPLHQSLVSGLRNHGTDDTFLLVKSSQPAEFGAFNGFNVQKPGALTKNEDRPAKKPRVLFNDEAQPSHNVAFDDEIRNRVIENTSKESQCDSISNGNHVAENISELQSLPSCNSISDSGHHAPETPELVSRVDSLPPWAPDQTIFSSLLSPLHPERGSSYSGVTNGDYNVLYSPLGFEWEDYLPNLPCTFELECSGVGTGYSILH